MLSKLVRRSLHLTILAPHQISLKSKRSQTLLARETHL